MNLKANKSAVLAFVATVLLVSSAWGSPSSTLSRIEVVEALAPLIPIEKQMAGNSASHYTDVDTITHPQRLILNGYLAQSNTKSGTSATLFSPDMTATRAQAAVMIHRMLVAQSPQWDAGVTRSVTLIDTTTVPWAKKALNALVNANVIQPIGPGYVFPKRAIDAQTATQWIDAAREFAVKPEPIKIRPEPTPSETQPTAAIVTVLTEPATPTEDVTAPTVPAQTPAPTVTQTKATQDHQWQIRAYGGFALGDSPYQSNQPPAEVMQERYIDVIKVSRRRDHGSIEAKRVYGIEGGVELNRRRIGKSLWLVTNYGRHIVRETTPATVINVPTVYIYKEFNPLNNKYNYYTNIFDGKYRTINLPEATVRKSGHTLRVGLRGPIYKKITPVATINGYLGGGLAISASTISGTAIELPKQNIQTYTSNVDGDDDKEAASVIPETIRRFHYTQNQVSVYGELGIMATRKAIHVGIQARFQENPGELSVDEKGRKRLTKERTLTGTIFSGITF